ncbi:MAG TPA: hypothetical protein VK658_23135 [Chryseolinea sp.]|nr:hypothetical protein [Chryseolinea sp.]
MLQKFSRAPHRIRSMVSMAVLQAGMMLWPGVWCTRVYAQQASFIQDLQGRLDRYYAAGSPLVIDMQFNQPAYVPGDTAWFSLWVTTEQQGLPVAGRQVVNVNLATRGGKVVLRHRVLVNNGLAHAQIVVPLTLQPGIYTVVAWTDWMTNDNPAMYGYKNFLVNGDRRYTPGPMPLRAYPEGGALVQGVSNQIVLAGSPGITASLHADKQVAGTLRLDAEGYGVLSVLPMAAVRYSVTDGQATVELPTASDGVAMALDFYDSASTLTFNLQSPPRGEGCQLAIVSRGRVVYAATISFQDHRASITVPKRILPEGLMLATVFDSRSKVLAERLLIVHAPANPVQVKADRSLAHPRERVSVSIEAADPGGTPLTVSIYADDLFANEIAPHDQFTPIARLPLGGLDFHVAPSWTMQQWNAFLTTQSWKRFQWPDIWNGRAAREQAVGRYLKFKGKVVLSEKNESFDSVRITFFLRGEARVYETYAARTGDFDLDLFFDFDNTEEVIYTVDRKGVIIPGVSIELAEELDPPFVLRPFASASTVDHYTAFALVRQSLIDAYQRYDITDDEASDPNAMVEDELFEADVVVKLDEFVLFPTMEETLREVVPRLQHRWRGKHHTVRVALSEPDILASADPLYFIDGVLTDDTDYFMSLSPKDIATIKIVSLQRKLQAMGILGRNGVVLVTTKLRNNHLQIPRTRKMFTAVGFTRPATFHNAMLMSTRTPIFRSTAYMNPALKLDADGKGNFEFVMPDNVGQFRIEVTGLSKEGTIYKAVTHVRSVPPGATP